MKKISLVLLIFVVVAPALAAQVELIEGKDNVDVTIDGRLFTTYQWGRNWPKPVLVPVRTPSGIEVSRRHPLTELEGGSESEYAIDSSLDMTAKVDEVVFEDMEEGVFAIRVADCLREKRPKTFLKPGDPAPKESLRGTGVYLSSNGDITAKQAWGKRARWMVLQGVILPWYL